MMMTLKRRIADWNVGCLLHENTDKSEKVRKKQDGSVVVQKYGNREVSGSKLSRCASLCPLVKH